MSYVIAEPCIGTKDNSCVEVCPVDCIHPTPDEPGYAEAEMLFIDPDECIDCDACVEASVAASSLETIVFRPSLVFDRSDPWIELIERLSYVPVIPIAGSGKAEFQPVWSRARNRLGPSGSCSSVRSGHRRSSGPGS